MPRLVSILLAIALLAPCSGSRAALALDPADAAWLRERGPLVLAFSEIPPFALLRDGRPSGYSVEILERAAAALGIGIELRQMPTEAGLAAVRSGAVDGLLNVAVTEARSAYLRYGNLTVPMEPRIFAHRRGPPLADLADLSGRRVAVWPAGLTAALIEGLDPPAVTVPVADQREALRAVVEGAADATIMDLRHGRWLLAEALITDLAPSPRAVVPLSGALFAVARDAERLAGLLDRAVAALPPAEVAALQAFWLEPDGGGAHLPVAPRAVTLSEAERAFLRDHPEVVLGIDAQWEPLVFRKADGTLTGIDVDTLDLIGAALGIRFRMELGVWDELVQRAIAGEIDGLTGSVAHPERRAHFRFTHPYTELRQAIYTQAGNPLGISKLGDLAGKRVGYQRGNLKDRKLIAQISGAIAVPLDDNLALIDALGSGAVDAAINTDTFMFLLARFRRPDIVPGVLLPDAVPLVFSIRKDWPELVSAMDKVLATLTPAEWLAISARYLPEGLFAQAAVALTALERDWLDRRGRRLRYCFSPVWRPYDYLEDGEHRGLFRDHLDLLGQKLGVTFEPVVSASWREALARSRAGDCELLSGAVATTERRAWLDFTAPFMRLTHVLVAPVNEPFVADLDALAGRVMTVPAASAIAAELREQHPEIELLEVSDLDAAVAALRAGRAYAALATLEHAADAISRGAGELRVIAVLPEPYPVSIAVRHDEPVLLGIMEKALASVTPAERDALNRPVTAFTIHQRLDLTRLWPFLPILLTAAGFLLLRQHELTRLNRALRKARDSAEAAAAAKGRFLAVMSHEMRTPMNVILGMARLCQESGVDARQQAWLERVQVAGHALLGLIDDVLDLSRHEAGALRLQLRPFVLDELLAGLAGLLEVDARSRGLRLTWSIDPRAPAGLVGDAKRLQQVLLNLAGNALKFTPTGSVRIAVTLLAANTEQARLHFAVSDSGIGIDAATRARLFTPFARGDESLSRRSGGAGLGLAISQDLVGLMGGHITCESTPGRGSTFAFAISCACSAESSLPWRHDRGLAGKHLLLHTTDPDLGLDALLAAFGLRVSTAPSTIPFDLVLVIAGRLPPDLPPGVPYSWYAPAGDPAPPDGIRPLPVSRLELFAELCARLEPTAEPSGLVAAPAPAVALAGRRLLLAEDHPASRDYVREVLIRAGAEVVLASDGDAAIAHCGDSAFDAVLMDVSMPGRDGLTATKVIRLLTGHATTPIIALTAHAGAEELGACLAAGMSDHLVKPVSPEDLLATLARWLPASAGPVAVPVDRSMLDTALGLARTGDPTLYRRLLTTFADEQHDGPARLAEAAASGDILTLSRITQGLVEVAPMLGATTLETAAHTLLAVRGDGPEASRPSVAALINALTDTLEAIAGLAPPPRPEVAQ